MKEQRNKINYKNVKAVKQLIFPMMFRRSTAMLFCKICFARVVSGSVGLELIHSEC